MIKFLSVLCVYFSLFDFKFILLFSSFCFSFNRLSNIELSIYFMGLKFFFSFLLILFVFSFISDARRGASFLLFEFFSLLLFSKENWKKLSWYRYEAHEIRFDNFFFLFFKLNDIFWRFILEISKKIKNPSIWLF